MKFVIFCNNQINFYIYYFNNWKIKIYFQALLWTKIVIHKTKYDHKDEIIQTVI